MTDQATLPIMDSKQADDVYEALLAFYRTGDWPQPLPRYVIALAECLPDDGGDKGTLMLLLLWQEVARAFGARLGKKFK